jgi:uncharacterized membrane protein
VLAVPRLASVQSNERHASEGPVVSAVIYAAIVVMWAVVLVPMWLRRHDAASESRSVDRFSTAMRTLSRRTSSGPGKRYVVMPRRGESAPTVHVSGAAAAPLPGRRTAPVTTTPAAAPRVTVRSPKSIVARRRRMLLGLAGVAFLTFVFAIAGILSWPLQAVFDVVVIAFVIHLRAQARRATAVSRTRSATPAARPAPRMPAAAPVQPTVAAPAAPAPAPAPAASASAATATAVDDWQDDDEWGDDTWQPVPVPRPTYTMKPPAPAYEADPTYAPPVYDPAERTAATGSASAAEAAPDSDLDEILERRWAVND